jgi:hypothetical protein
MKRNGYLVPFLAALVVSGALFLLMDMAVMNMQGLNLFFEP